MAPSGKTTSNNGNNPTSIECSLAKSKNGSADSGKSGEPDADPRVLIPELCNHMYHLGWASGTGGGLSIRQNGLIYCAPSGVQKERIQPQDMFVLDENTCEVVEPPKDTNLKISECLSLFMVAFKLRDAGCCLHSHSINANLVTSLFSKNGFNWLSCRRNERSGENTLTDDNLTSTGHELYEFRISHQEMIKGIKRGTTGEALKYFDTLVVPIIDNVAHERDLAGAMESAVRAYPLTNAVLVRNHGVYVWGRNWREAKSQAECYDYLFRLTLEAAKCGFDWMLDGVAMTN